MKEILFTICLGLIGASVAAPGSVDVHKMFNVGGSGETGEAPLFTFENGKVGVNFLGFKASAGLGGLLTGNAADGGLSASAGTPFGQSAGAGLGGTVDGNGRTVGGLYAGATAGSGVSAGAGLGGSTGSAGSVGGSFAGATAGGVEKHVIKYSESPAVAVGKPSATYVEKTVVPTYHEQTVFVPSYVEKTVRVPTVVQKKVTVEGPPQVFEKTVVAPGAEAHLDTSFGGNVGTYKYVEKVKIHGHHRPHLHHRLHHKYVGGAGFGGFGFGGFGAGATGVGTGGSTHVSVVKNTNPQLYNDIFNIPISTLGAVNKFLNGLAGGTSGSVSVNKEFHASG